MSQADTEARGDLAMDTSPMGTGPFRFVSHEDDTDFVFERFEEHFLPVDYPFVVSRYAHHKHQRVVVRPEIQSQLAGLEAGEIDVVPDLGPTNVEPYLDDADFTVQYQPGINGAAIQVLYPNLYPQTMPDGSPNPFLDFRVRRAANTRSTAKPSSTTSCSARATILCSRSPACTATRPRSSGRKSSTTTTPSWRGS